MQKEPPVKKINFVKPIKVNANKIIKSQGNVATLEVRVLATRVWLVKLRFFIGQKLIKLGCWIAYCDYKEVEKKD